MPWYKSGTVSVTLNSSAVIGAGTAFIANARVGDAFRGPDGAWYEVTNIASDTAMSISPNYKGATNAAGSYALAPMQGYVKDSADALRALVNTYGAKLAALGTTGNYDVLPVSKGGTGLTAVGTAISSDVMTSDVDTTAGRLLRVGDFGIGGTSGGMGVTDANLAIIPGFVRLNTPCTNAPIAGVPFSMLVTRYNQEVTQLAFQEGTAVPVVFVRKRLGATTWGNWRGVAMNGANTDITSLTGLTTALSTAQGGTGNTIGMATRLAAAAIIGTVSQSGGVPTGAIIERGSNANGSYVKFADGTMIASAATSQSFNLATAYGSSGAKYSVFGWSFPIQFAAIPQVFCSAQTAGRLILTGSVFGNPTVSSHSAFAIDVSGDAGVQTYYFNFCAIGRWY
ncbi:phage tail protein [Pseudomonas grandcourensis]|uniref:phage tail protein n=1 Tax=Pseudomonas grandcourensis TaxID=3136736 RepID=UPI003263670F